MLSQHDYKKCYVVLGVFQDDHWETIRTAYKRLIRRWHPDRFQEPAQREFAENKCKEINQSFRALDEFYQQHGHLPVVEPPIPVQDAVAADEHRAATTGLDANSVPAQPFPADQVQPDPAQPRNHGGFRTILVMGIVTAAALWITESSLFDRPEQDDGVSTDSSYTAPSIDRPLSAPMPGDDHPGTKLQTPQKPLLGEWDDKGMTPTTTMASASAGKHRSYIDVGSSKQEVLAVLGPPTRQTENAWEYGLSRINFRHGRVSDWYENPMNPLQTRK